MVLLSFPPFQHTQIVFCGFLTFWQVYFSYMLMIAFSSDEGGLTASPRELEQRMQQQRANPSSCTIHLSSTQVPLLYTKVQMPAACVELQRANLKEKKKNCSQSLKQISLRAKEQVSLQQLCILSPARLCS